MATTKDDKTGQEPATDEPEVTETDEETGGDETEETEEEPGEEEPEDEPEEPEEEPEPAAAKPTAADLKKDPVVRKLVDQAVKKAVREAKKAEAEERRKAEERAKLDEKERTAAEKADAEEAATKAAKRAEEAENELAFYRALVASGSQVVDDDAAVMVKQLAMNKLGDDSDLDMEAAVAEVLKEKPYLLRKTESGDETKPKPKKKPATTQPASGTKPGESPAPPVEETPVDVMKMSPQEYREHLRKRGINLEH